MYVLYSKDHAGHEHDTVKLMASKHRDELQKICTAPVEKMMVVIREKIEESKKKNREYVMKSKGTLINIVRK